MKHSIRIDKDVSGRIIVAFTYNPTRVIKVKTIQGYKWHPKEKLSRTTQSKTQDNY